LPFRYRGSRRESAVAQLSTLGHFRVFMILTELVWLAMIEERSISMSKSQIVRLVSARAGFARRADAEPLFRRLIL
jgi:hypothetical protein